MTPQVVVAIFSALIALCALGLSIYTGWLTRRHYKNTLRPIVNVDIDISPSSARYAISLHNCGPGVAIIRSWALSVDGMTANDLASMSSRRFTDLVRHSRLVDLTRYFPGDAIQAGQKVEIIGTAALEKTEKECEEFKNVLRGVKVSFEYESVYHDSWEGGFDGHIECVATRVA
jgi:hypothetical protein